jgi:hypothetical protein
VTRADIAARLDAHLRPYGRAKVSGLGFLCVSHDAGTHWCVLEGDGAERYLAWLDAGNKGTIWDMESV